MDVEQGNLINNQGEKGRLVLAVLSLSSSVRPVVAQWLQRALGGRDFIF